MALGATSSPELAQKVASATAKELKLSGINWAYSPVADVNSDSRNPVIGMVANFSFMIWHPNCFYVRIKGYDLLETVSFAVTVLPVNRIHLIDC